MLGGRRLMHWFWLVLCSILLTIANANEIHSKELQTPHRLARPAGIFRMLYQPGVYPHYRKLVHSTRTLISLTGIPSLFSISLVFLLLRLPSRQIERKCRIRCHF